MENIELDNNRAWFQNLVSSTSVDIFSSDWLGKLVFTYINIKYIQTPWNINNNNNVLFYKIYNIINGTNELE